MADKKLNNPDVLLLDAVPPTYLVPLVKPDTGKMYTVTAATLKAYIESGVLGGGVTAPQARAGLDQAINLPANSVTLDGTGSIASTGRTIVSYQWAKTSGPSSFNIISPSAPITQVNNLTAGNYIFQLTVTDSEGQTGIDTVNTIVNTSTAHVGPVANAGPTTTYMVPQGTLRTIDLVGSAAAGDSPITAYLWTRLSGPGDVTIASPTALVTTALNVPAGTHVFRLRVTDANGLTNDSQVSHVVNTQIMPVVITQHPVDATVSVGNTVSFLVAWTGQGPVVIDWFKNGDPVPNAHSEELLIPSTSFGNAGVYNARITNDGGAVTSNSAVLLVTLAGANVTVDYGWDIDDPYTAFNTPPRMLNPLTTTIVSGQNISIIFPPEAADKYLWWRFSSTQPNPTSYTYSNGLGGNIPDELMHTIIIASGFKYAVTRVPMAFEVSQPISLNH